MYTECEFCMHFGKTVIAKIDGNDIKLCEHCHMLPVGILREMFGNDTPSKAQMIRWIHLLFGRISELKHRIDEIS